jgi:hypothetical protein
MIVGSRILGAALISLAWTACAFGAPAKSDRQRASELKAVLECRGVQDTAQRLACYDKAAEALDAAEASGNVVIVDRKQAEAARKQAFGLSLPTLAIFDRVAPKGDVNSIESTLASASATADGRWVLVLEDGASWRQIDDTEVYPEPHKGSKVRIRRASLGSYVMNIDGQPWIKVHRQQ